MGMFLTFRRIAFLLGLSLALGVAVNQFHPNGIRWPLLQPRWNSADAKAAVRFISADSAFVLHLQGNINFIDVRPEEEYQIDRIPGAVSLPLIKFYQSPQMLEQLDPGKPAILYCFEPGCKEVNTLAKELAHRQFREVLILYGGFSEWLEKGYPVEE